MFLKSLRNTQVIIRQSSYFESIKNMKSKSDIYEHLFMNLSYLLLLVSFKD
jgi:hypothetical protein